MIKKYSTYPANRNNSESTTHIEYFTDKNETESSAKQIKSRVSLDGGGSDGVED